MKKQNKNTVSNGCNTFENYRRQFLPESALKESISSCIKYWGTGAFDRITGLSKETLYRLKNPSAGYCFAPNIICTLCLVLNISTIIMAQMLQVCCGLSVYAKELQIYCFVFEIYRDACVEAAMLEENENETKITTAMALINYFLEDNGLSKKTLSWSQSSDESV